MRRMWMQMGVWVYVSINACVKRAVIQLPGKYHSFPLSFSLWSKRYSFRHTSILNCHRKEIKTEKASIYTFKPIHSNDCHFNHNEPSVSGVCPFIIALIQCWFAWTAKPKHMINESSRCVEFKRNDPTFFFLLSSSLLSPSGGKM